MANYRAGRAPNLRCRFFGAGARRRGDRRFSQYRLMKGWRCRSSLWCEDRRVRRLDPARHGPVLYCSDHCLMLAQNAQRAGFSTRPLCYIYSGVALPGAPSAQLGQPRQRSAQRCRFLLAQS